MAQQVQTFLDLFPTVAVPATGVEQRQDIRRKTNPLGLGWFIRGMNCRLRQLCRCMGGGYGCIRRWPSSNSGLDERLPGLQIAGGGPASRQDGDHYL